jgi:geranylgeranyl pyrophosphate synthase
MTLVAWLEESRVWAERALEAHVPPADGPSPRLLEALRYAVFGGGKRLRPAVARLVAAELGAADGVALRPGVALELVHTYSLVHDDLPCMDDDDLRRGRATVHVAFDEATAVLVGDALLTLAFEVLSEAPEGARMTRVLSEAVGAAGMVGGQSLDLSLSPEAGLEELRDMHLRKTAALFGAAAQMGAIAAGADEAAEQVARDYGLALGLCFQATDDLLDVTGDAATLGKTPGKDANLGRFTLVSLLGIERARQEADELAATAREAAELLGKTPGTGRAVALVGHVMARSS